MGILRLYLALCVIGTHAEPVLSHGSPLQNLKIVDLQRWSRHG